jgi:hypothetical protein
MSAFFIFLKIFFEIFTVCRSVLQETQPFHLTLVMDLGFKIKNQSRMSKNNISAALTTTAINNINTAIATIRTNLPFLTNLTPAQRHTLAHAGSSRQGAIQDSLNFVAQHPEALPANFDTAEFAKDGELNTDYAPIVADINLLNQDVTDTMIVLQGDLYSEFLDVYAFAQANNRNGAYDTFIQSVKSRFARSPRTKPAAAPKA